MATTKRQKVKKPTRSQYEIVSPSGKKAHLTRVTTILDWTIKGDGFGAMPYYGANLLAEFLFDGYLDVEELQGVLECWKASRWDPNRKLKADADRGTEAHGIFQKLNEREWYLNGISEDGRFWLVDDGSMGLAFEVESYNGGACLAYDELFQHLEPEECLAERQVFWTEHPIDDCPDEICTHGYAGTADAIVLPTTMADMKTNKGDARWSAYPQMAMYGRAALQMGLIDAPIDRQIVVIPRPDGDYDIFDEKFVGDEVVDPILTLYRERRAWGPR